MGVILIARSEMHSYHKLKGFLIATARMMRLTTITTDAATTARMGMTSARIESPERKETAKTSAQERLNFPMSDVSDPETHCR